MSSDYESDHLLSDDLVLAEEATTSPQKPSAPRQPLQPRDANMMPATPPSSQQQTFNPEKNGASTLSTPASSQQHSNAPTINVPARTEPYRLAFGEHKGKTLDRVPERYLEWLQKNVSRPPALRDALKVWQERRRGNSNSAPSSSQPLSTPTRPPASQQQQQQLPTPCSPHDMLSKYRSRPPSQIVPPPSTMPAPRPEYAPPSSSQPTPSKSQPPRRALQPELPSSQPTPPAATPSQRLPPPSSQPILYRNDTETEQPLYRLPFGTHRGKTLLEVPEHYIAYLLVDSSIADNMPGLGFALRLLGQGERPVRPAPLAPSPTVQPEPPSSAPVQPLGSSCLPTPPVQRVQHDPPSSAPPQSQPLPQPADTQAPTSTPVAPEPYRLDFGMHAGKTLLETPFHYLSYLKQAGIVETKPLLAAALAQHERLYPPASQWRFTFGKHKGALVADVPDNYIDWLKASPLWSENADLRAAVVWHERHAAVAPTPTVKEKKAAKKRKRGREYSEPVSGAAAPKRKSTHTRSGLCKGPRIVMGW
ncbi:hypothetical protein BDV95DRAFT_216581 [Massariosphaeria phaeospora]|uniref:Uncharacterized protein n=1 Tax=Massariosphaeria phaeospora TaxID=100035 RepID=A0A7C8ICH7_9PLEO|nr:hypothetical protein BDV95DRAFT_216581 [Massariosphaeria phaeospora]